jgi:hypothetical protein
MTFDDFTKSLDAQKPQPGLSEYLEALWFDAKGDWERAHTLVQDINTSDAAWVHAYLHRKEGDNSNAGYWYRRAGKPVFTGTLDQEWEALVNVFLSTFHA